MYHHSESFETAELPVNSSNTINKLVKETQGINGNTLVNSAVITPENSALQCIASPFYGYNIPDLYTNTQDNILPTDNREAPCLFNAQFRDPIETTIGQSSPNYNAFNNSSNPKPDTVNNISFSKPEESQDEIEIFRNTVYSSKLNSHLSRRKNLENTVRLIEDVIVNSQNITNHNAMVDPLNIKTELIYSDEEETNEDVEMDTEDFNSNTKSQISHTDVQIKIESDTTKNHPTIHVKIEPQNVVDTDFNNPFCRDVSGVLAVHAGDVNVIEGSESVAEATSAIQNAIYPEVYYKCNDCQLLFRHAKRFLIHTKWHSIHKIPKAIDIRNSQVNLSEKITEEGANTPVASQNENKALPTAGKTFPCKQCDKVFIAFTTLNHHQNTAHSDNEWKCRVCGVRNYTRSVYIKHTATHRGPDGYICPQCPKVFKHLHSLHKHVDTHLEKTHECNQCQRKYESVFLLNMHLKRHEKAASVSFSCSYCGKVFTTSYNCKVHESIHRNDKLFTCEICKSTFRSNSSLVRHNRRSHSDAKPYVCSVCRRSFLKELTRDRHEIREHGDPEQMKFACKDCPCRYTNKKELNRHTYRVHPKGKTRNKDESDSE